MKHLLSVVFMMMVFMIGCGTSNWNYTDVNAPNHMANVKHIPVHYDGRFSPEQQVALKEAVAEWNHVFNGQVVLDMDEKPFSSMRDAAKMYKETRKTGLGIVILDLNEDDPILQDEIEPGDGTLAFVQKFGGHVMFVIGDRLGGRDLKTISMHEFGHLFGCFHVNAPSLMFPYYGGNQVDCIDKVSAAQASGYMKLDMTKMNYCVTPTFQ